MSESIRDRAMREAMGGRMDAALASVRLHLKVRPGDQDARLLLSELLQIAGQTELSLQENERLLERIPGNPHLRLRRGELLLELGRDAAARAELEALVAERPEAGPAAALLCLARLRTGDTDGAVTAGHEATRRDAASPAAWGNLLHALKRAGRMEEAVEAGRRGVRHCPASTRLRSMLLLSVQSGGASPAEVTAMHREYGALLGAATDAARTEPDPQRPIRIGLLSADLHGHSVASFLEPFLRHPHARASIEAFSLLSRRAHDATTALLREGCSAWHDCDTLSDEAIALLIRRRSIDVLLELGGHTGDARLGIVAARPAPVIVSAIGYPCTTGVPAVGWRLVDSITDPPGSEALSTERLLRVDPCFLCYAPPAQAPEPAMPDAESPITFGSFNNASKVSDLTLDLWSEVMRATPGSRLLLKSQGMGDACGRRHVASRLAARGIDEHRIEFAAFTPTRAEHLALYARMHVALDTTPYNGTTTTCEALWMGVPVVTMTGDHHAARVSTSLLRAAGLAELVAVDPAGFTRIAASLAGDRSRLAALRRDLRSSLQRSPLLDAASYAARLHAGLRSCFDDWCSSRA